MRESVVRAQRYTLTVTQLREENVDEAVVWRHGFPRHEKNVRHFLHHRLHVCEKMFHSTTFRYSLHTDLQRGTREVVAILVEKHVSVTHTITMHVDHDLRRRLDKFLVEHAGEKRSTALYRPVVIRRLYVNVPDDIQSRQQTTVSSSKCFTENQMLDKPVGCELSTSTQGTWYENLVFLASLEVEYVTFSDLLDFEALPHVYVLGVVEKTRDVYRWCVR